MYYPSSTQINETNQPKNKAVYLSEFKKKN